ncbi:hypothetical protein [uncultured Ruegeria sp.]|uniref:hypothetical protein n=1 Tax=uncultured Ruegeria sp. TaxID=259304 RepID=UPI00263032F4|nr:hypothetical protein [uncultured Ruegeria sp.]
MTKDIHLQTRGQVIECLNKAAQTVAVDANRELDRLAAARSDKTGEPYLKAYEAVCEAHPELTEHALGGTAGFQPEKLPLSHEDIEFDLAVRNSDETRALKVGLDTKTADRETMRRAQEEQVRSARSGRLLSLPDAIEVVRGRRT